MSRRRTVSGRFADPLPIAQEMPSNPCNHLVCL